MHEHTHTYTNILSLSLSCTRVHTHTHTHSHTHSLTLLHTPSCSSTLTQSFVQSLTLLYTHSLFCLLTHSHLHTHAHTLTLTLSHPDHLTFSKDWKYHKKLLILGLLAFTKLCYSLLDSLPVTCQFLYESCCINLPFSALLNFLFTFPNEYQMYLRLEAN